MTGEQPQVGDQPGTRPPPIQFRMRTMFAGMLACALGLAIIAWWYHERTLVYRLRAETQSAVRSLGGMVAFPRDHEPAAWLQLQGTRTSDKDLERLTSLRGVEVLLLSNTQITDGGLRHLSRLGSLTELYLDRTAIGDEGLEHLVPLHGLEVLVLSNTRITDRGLSHVSQLPNLAELSVNGTPITNEALKHLSGLDRLRSLNIQDTQITAAGLQHLEGWTHTEDLHLDEGQMTSVSAAYLRKLSALKTIHVRITSATGRSAWDQLITLDGIEWWGRLPSNKLLWANGSAWEHTTGGVVEMMAEVANLDEAEGAKLADIIDGYWSSNPHQSQFGVLDDTEFTRVPSAPEQDTINRADDFVQAVIVGDLPLVRMHADSEAARIAIPALLELLEKTDSELRQLLAAEDAIPDSGEQPGVSFDQRLLERELDEFRDRVAFVLFRIGSDEPEVIAAFGRLLNERRIGRAFGPFYSMTHSSYMQANYTRRWMTWNLGPEDAEAALSLLRENGQGDAFKLAHIVAANPQHASEVIPAILEMTSNGNFTALNGIVLFCSPQDTETIIRGLLTMLDDDDPAIRAEAGKSLNSVAEAVPDRAVQ